MKQLESIVRRLTPTECERLMGFPDNYLAIDGEKTPDSPRYKACGNSWGVNCAAWVTKRIHDWDIAHGGRGITNYATVCSGVEAQSLALKACGIDAKGIFFSEIEKFPCRVLAHHYPNVPNLGDMTKIQITKETITNGTVGIIRPDEIDLFSGGTPCQDFSVAGKRAGGERGSGTRSSLCWTWLDLIRDMQPRFVIWENVQGCLSSGNPHGSDFAQLATSLGQLGYSVAWRTLDVQYTRVDGFPRAIPQRRRRVWMLGVRLVGRVGADGERGGLPAAAEILLERESVLGDSAPLRITGQEIAGCVGERAEGSDSDVGIGGVEQ